MLRNIVAPLILASSIGLAKEFNHEKFQILAKDIDTEKNIVTAKGNVVVFSSSYYISAGKIVYNKENETFELFDNVLILRCTYSHSRALIQCCLAFTRSFKAR